MGKGRGRLRRCARLAASGMMATAGLGAAAAAAQTPQGLPTGPTAASGPPGVQDQAPARRAAAPSSTSADTGGVGEIIVTAQKREQNLQDVPIVVTVVTTQALQDAGVRDIKDLTVLTPGLLVTSTSSEASTTARIRGIGTVGDNAGLESSVGVVVDGVYRPRNGVGFGDIGELARVEVLKGPQGTLFGKNTSAGVINIVTAQPSFTPGANAEFTIGNYNEIGGSAAVTGPLIADKLAGALFFAQRTRDGFTIIDRGKGPRASADDYNRSFYTMRGQLLYTPTNDLSARLILDYSRRSEDCCVGQQYRDGATAPLVRSLAAPSLGLAIPANPSARLSYANRTSGQATQDGGGSLEINYTLPGLNGAKITSVTAARDWKLVSGQDSDFTSADILYRPQNGDQGTQFQQFSQELRLGGTIGRLDYTIGGFFAHELLKQRTSLLYGTDYSTYLSSLLLAALPTATAAALGPTIRNLTSLSRPGTGQRDYFKQDDETYAFFTNDTYHVTDQLELTGGLRYTRDSKSLTARYNGTDRGATCAAVNNPASPLFGFASTLCQGITSANNRFVGVNDQRSRSESAVTGTGKLAYRFSPEYLGYVSYSRGYKSGGYNLDRQVARDATGYSPVLDTSFKPEFADSYEVGLKTTLLDKRLLLNGAVFHQEYDGFQLNSFNGLYFAVVSVPKVNSTGVDADFLWRPFRELTVTGGATYANTRYAGSDAAVLGRKCQSIVFGAAASAAQPAGCSFLPGSRLSLAPLWSVSGSATYEHTIRGDLMGRANVGVKFSTAYNTGSDLNPVKVQNDYAVVDARIGVGPRDRRWSVELYVANLFDKTYNQVIYDAPFQSGSFDTFLGPPRTFGATLRARY